MDPSTLGSTRRRATVAMLASLTTSEASRMSIERKPPVPMTSRDVERSEPTRKSCVTRSSVLTEGTISVGLKQCNPFPL
jgi:hypothetical protein